MKPTDYLTSDRRGRDAHDLELEAQCDPFVAEALQGLEETPGDHREAVELLRLRIAERAAREARRRRLRRIRQRTAAAAAVLLLLTAGIMTWHRAPVGELPPAVQLADGTVPSTADKQAGEQPATGTAPAGNPSADHRAEARSHPRLPDPADNTATDAEYPNPLPDAVPADNIRGTTASDNEPTGLAPDAPSAEEFDHIVVTAYGIVHKAPYTGSAKKVETTVHSLMDDAETGEPEGPDGSATERGAKVTTKVLAEEFVWEGDGSSSRPESGIVNTPGADGAFLVAEVMPLFREGDIYYKEFRQWVQARTRTPGRLCRDTTWQTMRVITSFVIDSTGRLIQPTVLRSPDSQLSRRALRILKNPRAGHPDARQTDPSRSSSPCRSIFTTPTTGPGSRTARNGLPQHNLPGNDPPRRSPPGNSPQHNRSQHSPPGNSDKVARRRTARPVPAPPPATPPPPVPDKKKPSSPHGRRARRYRTAVRIT